MTDPVDAALAAVEVHDLGEHDDCPCGLAMVSPAELTRHRMEVAIGAARPLILAEALHRSLGLSVASEMCGSVSAEGGPVCALARHTPDVKHRNKVGVSWDWPREEFERWDARQSALASEQVAKNRPEAVAE